MKTFSKISASHYVLPAKNLTNADLSSTFEEAKLRNISRVSGILERRVAPAGVTALDLGFEAARRMLEAENIAREDFDMLIFVSQTGDHILPASAYVLHEKLSLPKSCGAFDMPLGCPAMPYALTVANGLIASGQCGKILLVFADTITKLVYPKDRSLVTLHGDGAAAFTIEKSGGRNGLEFVELGVQSTGWKSLMVPAGGMRLPKSAATKKEITSDAGVCTTDEHLQMDGMGVFQFSTTKIPSEICAALKKHEADISDFDLVLLHQANRLITDQIYKKIGADKEQQFMFMEKVGNLSAASTPVLLARALREGRLDKGGRVLLCSFGVGLTWGTFAISFGKNSVKTSKKASDELA